MKPDTHVWSREDVIAARAAGRSFRAIARESDLPYSTVKRWCDALQPVTPREPRVVRPANAPATVNDLDTLQGLDGLAIIRELIETNRRAYREAEASGDATRAQLYSRTLAMQLPVLARLEAAANVDGDVLRISRSEIEAAVESLQMRLQALANRPLLCEHCSRELVRVTAEGKGHAHATETDGSG